MDDFVRLPEGETSPEDPPTAAPARRCSKITRAGTPCLKPPIKGGTVCINHGGGAPQVKAAASLVLLAARDHAAALLRDVIEWWRRDTCAECGYPKQDPGPAIRAAIAVLDRTGFGPSASLKISEASGPQPWLRWLTNDEYETQVSLMTTATERKDSGLPPFAAGGIRLIQVPGDTTVVLLENGREPQVDFDDGSYVEIDTDEEGPSVGS